MHELLRAVIFIAQVERHNAALLSLGMAHIEASGYRFDSVVWDWNQLIDMLAARTVDVVVYVRPEHISSDWVPRLELAQPVPPGRAADTQAAIRISRGSRRPRIVR